MKYKDEIQRWNGKAGGRKRKTQAKRVRAEQDNG
jgi:hypothetical protein